MSRSIVGLAVGAIALAGCGRSVEPGAPRYELRDCRKVELVDAETRNPVVGAEDVRVDHDRNRLLVSAYDRRAAERAAANGSAIVPEGGVYAVDLDALATDNSVVAKPLIERSAVAGGLRPHGLYLDDATGRIAFVNRAYVREERRSLLRPQLVQATEAGEILDAAPTHCAANAVILGEETLASFDHRHCGWRGGLDDLLGGGGSGVAGADGQALFEGARYANGLAPLRDGRLALAATREKAILVLAPVGDGSFTESRKISVPGGPDNITKNDRGALVVAVHPSLWTLGLQRRLGWGRAPSRVVEVDPSTGRTRLLLNDPAGRKLSAITSAAEHGAMLYAGSAVDSGVLVCEGPRE